MKQFIYISVILSAIVLICTERLVAQQVNNVYISEIMYDSPLEEDRFSSKTHNNGEYIKLYNPLSQAVNMSGWKLYDMVGYPYTFPNGTFIQAQGVLLLTYMSGNSFDFASYYHIPANNILKQSSIILANKGKTLSLYDNQNNLVDIVTYTGNKPQSAGKKVYAKNPSGTPYNKLNSLHRIKVSHRNGKVFSDGNNDLTYGLANPTGKGYVVVNDVVPPPPTVDPEFQRNMAGKNYIITRSFTNEEGTKYLDQIAYFDGLGRPVQAVQRGITPSGKDLVTYQEYDAFGRESKAWLPRAKTDNNGEFVNLTDFKDLQNNIYNGDVKPYMQPVYEASPLNRVLKQYGAGAAWNPNDDGTEGHPVEQQYGANDATSVPYFYINAAGSLQCGGNYNANQLYKTTVIDEDNKSATEYTDKLGRLVMQQNSTDVRTCYVYDDYGRLRYVLPPLAVDKLNSAVIIPDSHDAITKYAYIYKYDERGRVIEKKLPGCDPVKMIYDSADRLIFSQDGNQAKTGKWTFSIPDKLGRPVITGVLTKFNNTDITANNIKDKLITATFNAANSAQAGYDIYINNTAVTLQDFTLLTVNYYDNYGFLQTLGTATAGNLGEDGNNSWNNAKGLLTGTRTYILDNSGTYTTAAIYYDYKGQVIQTRATNHLGGYDIAYNEYDFTGNITNTLKTHTTTNLNPPQGTIKEAYLYTYDHAGRLIDTYYTLNDGTKKLLTKNSYDEIGRLIEKERDNQNDSETFEYNIRSQITKIQSGNFVQNLYYNTNPINQNPCFNGNISYNTWTYNNDIIKNKYTYDALNRLTSAISSYDNAIQGDFEGFSYDKQGNIQTLYRGNNDGDLDALYFTYNGNQIKNITDDQGSYRLYNVKEYQDLARKDIEFEYDKNGNMTVDLDREILEIKYNILNLPDKVTFKSGAIIVNLYDASGKKVSSGYLTKTSNNITPLTNTIIGAETLLLEPATTQLSGLILSNPLGAGLSTTNTSTSTTTSSVTSTNVQSSTNYYEGYGTEYVGNIEYETEISNSTLGSLSKEYFLNRIHNAEGYVTDDNQYHYYRRDHLGNNREVWNATTGQTVQRTQYYPSGLPMETATSDNAGLQPYKFNGKEFIEAHGLDEYYSYFRNYYPAIMRTTTIDAYAENHYDVSPYVWAMNNPLRYIDPLGLDTTYVNPIPIAEVTVTATRTWTSEMEWWGYGWSYESYQEQYPYSQKMTRSQAEAYWNDNYRTAYMEAWKADIEAQHNEEMLHKLSGFALVFSQLSMVTAIGSTATNLKLGRLSPRVMSLPPRKVGVGTADAPVVHGNSLKSLRPTSGYKLYSSDGTFLKNGITSQVIPEARYTKSFMSDKYMESILFPNRKAAWDWEYLQNLIQKGPLNKNMH